MSLDQNKLARDLQSLAANAAANNWTPAQVQQNLAKVIFDFVSAATVSGVTVALADGSQASQIGSVTVT
jgi:hypothetical protein